MGLIGILIANILKRIPKQKRVSRLFRLRGANVLESGFAHFPYPASRFPLLLPTIGIFYPTKQFNEYDDLTVRCLVEYIRVMDARLIIVLKGGLTAEATYNIKD